MEIQAIKNLSELKKFILIEDEINKICITNNIIISDNDAKKIALCLVSAQRKVNLKISKINMLKFTDQPHFKKELAWLFDEDEDLSLDDLSNR